MENIGIYSFYGCSNLNGCLVIPDGIQSIGENSFAYTGFTSLTFNGTMEPKCDRPIFEEGKFIELSLSSDYKNTSFCFVNEEINTNTIESITLPTNEDESSLTFSEVILSTIITDMNFCLFYSTKFHNHLIKYEKQLEKINIFKINIAAKYCSDNALLFF